MNTLIMTVGLPRSGKSSWAKTQGYPVVTPDSIRLALYNGVYEKRAEAFVWATAEVMVRALFISGHTTVILDSTNMTTHRRREWKSDDWKRLYQIFSTPAEECIRRAKETNQEYLIPVIEKMDKEKEPIESADLDDD